MPEQNAQLHRRIRLTTACFSTLPMAAAELIRRRPARLGPARRQRLKPPPATGNRLKPIWMIAGGRKTGSAVAATYSSNGSRQSERGYYAFGDDRRTVNTPLTDHLFTGQKQDESGLYYYNARYYDPEIGHFISPDTLVPEPLRVDSYNRYMYALGNPLKFNDPSGHCALNANGDPDTVGDYDCWQLAYGIYGFGLTEQSFADDWRVSPDEWLKNIAGTSYATIDSLKPFYDKYEREFRGRTGLHTGDMHDGPPVPGWVDEIYKVSYDPLYACAIAVGGTCGMSYGLTYVDPGIAVRGSGDFYVDSDGNFAVYGSFGAGPAVMIWVCSK